MKWTGKTIGEEIRMSKGDVLVVWNKHEGTQTIIKGGRVIERNFGMRIVGMPLQSYLDYVDTITA